ncbi:MAG: saccharopine dehydrogenase NADP-binding domain-containing protein [Deltaproteobacteria bacterium]|nr:saccharopine dehydrogenase NADP-binding domain-containing protein [Deltaproteobacteria bacterium]
MKRVLILGAGLVTRPIVRYLLEQANLAVTVASRTVSKAEALIAKHPNGQAKALNVDDGAALEAAIKDCDVAISLLPWIHHLAVAKLCIKHRKHLVTTSYVSPAMKELDSQVREADLLFLNEIGVDPGIDHMSAQQIIDQVKGEGGQIVSFLSYCGGLPAPDADNNPWNYKFSWSPRGVVLAARNAARYLENGKLVEVPNWDYFATVRYLPVDGLGVFESYPNRDSIGYIDVYGLQGIQTIYRGTLRVPGHCATWTTIARSGLLDLEERVGMAGKTYAEFICGLTGGTPDEVRPSYCRKTGIPITHNAISRLEWLGMFSDEKIGIDRISPLDVLANRLDQKLRYAPGERDMLVLVHEFVAEIKGKREYIRSQMVDFGIPDGDTSMARTVSLPAAIATRMICEGRIKLTGVRIPVDRAIYEPVLRELATMNIVCRESRRPL